MGTGVAAGALRRLGIVDLPLDVVSLLPSGRRVDIGRLQMGDYGYRMPWDGIVATSEWDVWGAARTMLEHGFRYLVVIDGASAHEVRILSIRDLMAGILGCSLFFFQAEDGIRDPLVTGVQTCALPI